MQRSDLHRNNNPAVLEQYMNRSRELVNEFVRNVEHIDANTSPTLAWQNLLVSFVTQYCREVAFPEAGVPANASFALCMAGQTMRNLGTPKSTIDMFVIVSDPAHVPAMKAAMMLVENSLLLASQLANNSRVFPLNLTIRASKLCGTQTQVLGVMRDNIEPSVNAIYTSGVILGKAEYLDNLRTIISSQAIKDQSPHHSKMVSYLHPACFFYDKVTDIKSQYAGAVHKTEIHFKNDALRPFLFILDGLRLEFGLSNELDPKQIIHSLKAGGHLSVDAALLMESTFNLLMRIKWQQDGTNRVDSDMIPLNEQTRQLMGRIGVLRAATAKRVTPILNDRISLNPDRPTQFTIDKANLDMTDRLFNHDEIAFDAYAIMDEMRGYLTNQSKGILESFQRSGNSITGAALAGRILNKADKLTSFPAQVEMFFLCIDKEGQLDSEKFNAWLAAAARRCAKDICERDGGLKLELVKALNDGANNWYAQVIVENPINRVNKMLLHTYHLNVLFNNLLEDPRFLALSRGMNAGEGRSVNRDQNKMTEAFFGQQFTNNDAVTLSSLQSENYRSQLAQQARRLHELIMKCRQTMAAYPVTETSDIVNRYVGNDKDLASLQGLYESIDKHLRNQRDAISTEVYHDYQTKIWDVLAQFSKALSTIEIPAASSTPLTFFTGIFSNNKQKSLEASKTALLAALEIAKQDCMRVDLRLPDHRSVLSPR